MIHQRWRFRHEGFSLFEILIAMLIAGILFEGLSRMTGGMLKGWSRSATALEEQSAGFTALTTMADELNALLPLSTINSGLPVAYFSGSQNYLEFARHAIGFETQRDLNSITYQVENTNNGLAIIRRSRALQSSRPFNTGAQSRTVLAELQGDVRFEFSKDGQEFVTNWINQPSLPKLIRITLELNNKPGFRFVKTASPMIDATSECLSPTYRAICDYQWAN